MLPSRARPIPAFISILNQRIKPQLDQFRKNVVMEVLGLASFQSETQYLEEKIRVKAKRK